MHLLKEGRKMARTQNALEGSAKHGKSIRLAGVNELNNINSRLQKLEERFSNLGDTVLHTIHVTLLLQDLQQAPLIRVPTHLPALLTVFTIGLPHNCLVFFVKSTVTKTLG